MKYKLHKQKARQWYQAELANIEHGGSAPNRFDHFVPVEVRAYTQFLKSIGVIPKFTESHFALWAMIGEITGTRTFDKPLGISPDDVLTHLVS